MYQEELAVYPFKNNTCYVAFQKSSQVADHDKVMIGRTLEETFIYENIALFRNKKIAFGKDLPEGKDFEEEYKNVFNTIKSSAFKKTEFALNVASSASDWVVPKYIADGLIWLEDKIAINATEEID